MSATILFGCGGSGIETLKRLNELISEDPYWRKRVEEDIYYVVVDTETAKVEEFESLVRSQMRGSGLPVIKTVLLSKGVDALHQLVNPCFVDSFKENLDQKGRERLFEHWWVKEEKPFDAPKVVPLAKGAGQCAPVSFFLAWHWLPEITKTLEELLQEIKVRQSVRHPGANPFDNINVVFIAGLAGGTGRGCWQVICFKIRELLLKGGHGIAPVAVLFDSSVFDNVAQENPETQISMQVNSLTGLSELSCWLKHVHKGPAQQYRYRLPHMEMPAREDSDVLDAQVEITSTAASPVDNAFLIFRQGDLTLLDTNVDYHQMAGTGLYGMITKSSIEGRRINVTGYPYHSYATATFEVPAATLRLFFEKRCRLSTSRQLLLLGPEEVLMVQQAKEEFFKKNRVLLHLNDGDWGAFRAEADGTYLQVACARLLKKYENQLSQLDKLIKDGKSKEVKKALKIILGGSAKLARDAVNEATESFARQQPAFEQAVRNAAEQVFLKTRSIRAAWELAHEICIALEVSMASLPQDPKPLSQTEHPDYLADVFSTRKYWIAGEVYDNKEREELILRTRAAVLNTNYKHLRPALEEVFKGWIERLSAVDADLARIRDASAKLENTFAEALRGFKEVFEFLFTDPAKIEMGIPSQFDPKKFCERRLRPIVAGEAGLELLARDAMTWESHLLEFLGNEILQSPPQKPSSRRGLMLDKDFTKRLQVEVETTVSLKPGFLDDHFSIPRVVEDLRTAWTTKFNAEKGNENRFTELVKQFQAFFGCMPKRDGDQFVLPEVEEMIICMATSLAGTCKPFWQTKKKQPHRVDVFLPFSGDEQRILSAMKRDLRQTEIKLVMETATTEEDELAVRKVNPFVILAYSSEVALEEKDIASLKYWSSSPDLVKWLVRCENPSGESIFSVEDGNKGIGYADPVYARDPLLRELRWKPWAPKELPPPEVEDAMVYAMLKPDPHSRLARELAKYKWAMPLIRDTGEETFIFTRKAFNWDAENKTTDDGGKCPWTDKKRICQSVWQVYDILAGKGNKTGRYKEEGPEWRKRILEESKVFYHEVLPLIGCGKGSTEFKLLVKSMNQTLGRLHGESKGDDQATWGRLIERLKSL